MIKKPKFTDKGDMVVRCTYVVQAKQNLVQFISQRKNLDAQDIEYLLEPTVVTTPEVAFEEHLESWRLPLENKCKEGFLRSIRSMEPLIDMEPPKSLFKDMSVLVGFFDQFWSIVKADLVELEMDTWKTRDCFHSPSERC